MARSLSDLLTLEIRRALRRRGLLPTPRRRRRRSSRRARPAATAAPLSPPPLQLRPFDFDPSDFVTDYVPVPGACMADMEDGEQPFGPFHALSPPGSPEALASEAPRDLAQQRAA